MMANARSAHPRRKYESARVERGGRSGASASWRALQAQATAEAASLLAAAENSDRVLRRAGIHCGTSQPRAGRRAGAAGRRPAETGGTFVRGESKWDEERARSVGSGKKYKPLSRCDLEREFR